MNTPIDPTIKALISPAPLLMRVGEAARLLGFSRAMMYKMIAAGDINVVRYGKAIRIAATELPRWIAAHTLPPVPGQKGDTTAA